MKKILFSNELANPQNDKKYIYLDYIEYKSKNFDLQDLKKIINLNYDKWLSEAKELHDEISIYYSSINKDWWLTDSSRFIMWKTKTDYSLNNYFYAKAIIELSKSYDDIVVVGQNEIIQLYINSLSSKKDLSDNQKNNKKVFFNFKSSGLIVLKISFLALLNAIKFGLILLKKSKPKIFQQNLIMVSTMALNHNIIKEKKDHFFGDMLEPTKYLWAYNDYPNKLNQIKECIKDENKSYLFVLEFGSIKIIIKSLFSFWTFQYDIFFNKNFFIKNKIKNQLGWVFFCEFFTKKLSFENILYEIYLSKIYLEIFNIIDTKKIILPYEENGWERSILREAKKKNIKTFGYAHASHSQGHKYYFSISKKINPIRPTKILVTGKNALLKFKDMNYKEDNLIILGSGKYHKRNEIKNFSKNEKKTILFMCGLGLEIVNLAKLLNNDENFFKKYNLIIRENPHSWAEEHLLAKKILIEKKINYQISKKDFKNEILNSKYIIYETSTAGLEGILMGRLGIQMNITDNIYSNQFHDINDKKIRYCMNMKEIKNLIDYYESLDEKKYYKLVDEQITQVANLIENKNQAAIDLIESLY